MFTPNDRSVLLDLLQPPPGMELDVAVATTFTLDLEAALMAPLGFASFGSAGFGDPIASLQAIRSVADKLTVFVQAGEVRTPSSASDLFASLEPIVHQVARPRPGRLFHPKLWLLRYIGDEQPESMRLLVPTRNLTNDESWDAVLRLDGTVQGAPQAKNRPLADLVRWCASNTLGGVGRKRLEQIESLCESARRTAWELPDGILDLDFYSFGIGKATRPDFSGFRRLVISPFINAEGVEILTGGEDATVVSRPEQLAQLPSEILENLECHAMTSAELNYDDPSNTPLGDLHAKVFVVERGQRAHLFVGSTNATGAAFDGNVEVLVELQGGRKVLGIDTMLSDLRSVLEPCSVVGGAEPSERDLAQKQLDEIVRHAAHMSIELTPVADGDNTWRLDVRSEKPLINERFVGRATVELLSRRGFAIEVPLGAPLNDSYVHVPLADITPFLAFRVEVDLGTETLRGGSVLKATLTEDPPGRLDAILARQVDSTSKFLRFLYLMLGLADGAIPPWLQASADDSEFASDAFGRMLEAGVFETMTRSLASNPAALEQLASLVAQLQKSSEGTAILPDGFVELWEALMKARRMTQDTK